MPPHATQWELTPVAIAAGRLLADRLFKPAAAAAAGPGAPRGAPASRLVYADIPTVVFSHPPSASSAVGPCAPSPPRSTPLPLPPSPVGTVGLTEAAARAEFGDAAVKVRATSRTRPTVRALRLHRS